jgi:NUMOD4 motif
MNREVWKTIPYKRFSHYKISDLGRLFNTRTDKFLEGHILNSYSDLLYVYLCNKGHTKRYAVHKLVAKAFGKLTRKFNTAYHNNYIQDDNRNKNLTACTPGEAGGRTRRHNNELNKRKRGVYKYSHPKSSNKWRAMFNLGKMYVKTIGYYKTYKEAETAYKKAYSAYYGSNPY